MAAQLLNSESKQSQLFLNNDVFVLTDKRLIFNDKFIGLNELRSANVKTIDLTHNEININLGNLWFYITCVITIICGIVYGENQHSANPFGDIMAGILFFSPVGAIGSGIIIAIINQYVKSKTRTVVHSQVTVTKTDNSVFLNQYYDIDKFEELKEFETAVNNLIYK